ncbi:MAG: ABC transporter permease [Rhodospirillales bacterium]|nr:ABC transporter permease [Rhodospirillales bacterium]
MPARAWFDAADPQRLARALEDLREGFAKWRLAATLARLDIRNRYRGSVLGPLWLTLSTGLMLAMLGVLYSALFHQTLRHYVPFLAVSLIVWNLISQVVTDACISLVMAEGLIRQVHLPYTTHALRGVFRNIVIAAHNLPLILIAMLAVGHIPGPEALLAVPGFALLAVDAFAAALFLGMICARFRDIGQIVATVMQIAFFMTPVLWPPASLGRWAVWLPIDPFFSVMEVVRAPLLGHSGGALIWISAACYSAICCGLSLAFFVRFRGRIAFWV